jgi:hypothetical protein
MGNGQLLESRLLESQLVDTFLEIGKVRLG